MLTQSWSTWENTRPYQVKIYYVCVYILTTMIIILMWPGGKFSINIRWSQFLDFFIFLSYPFFLLFYFSTRWPQVIYFWRFIQKKKTDETFSLRSFTCSSYWHSYTFRYNVPWCQTSIKQGSWSGWVCHSRFNAVSRMFKKKRR